MNIAKTKEQVESHVNLASSIKDMQNNLDFKKLLAVEHDIMMDINVKELINTFEVKMIKQFDKHTIARLLCLLSVTQNGLKQEFFDHLRRLYVWCYGYQEINTLINLQEAGLFKVKGKEQIDWKKLKTKFSLISEEVNIANPNDIAYVYGGYAPLSIRFIEQIFNNKGFARMGDCKYNSFHHF